MKRDPIALKDGRIQTLDSVIFCCRNFVTMGLEDCYRSLGLKPGASREQIKAAYRTFARKLHPDTRIQEISAQQPETLEDPFLIITQAYKQLMAQQQPSFLVPETPKTPATPNDTLKYKTYQHLRQLFAQQRFANAIALVEGLAARFPHDQEVRQWKAIAYQQQGLRLIEDKQYLQATRYLEKAIVTDPTNRTLKSSTHGALRKIQRLTHLR